MTTRCVARRVPRLVGLLLVVCAASAGPTAAEPPLALVKERVRLAFPRVPQLDAGALEEWLSDPARPPPVLLDVREKEEYAVSHLPGARRAPSVEAALRLLAGMAKDAPIVAYCAVGYRSSALVRELRARGYTNARNLEGSIFEWANRGLPVYRDGRAVREVHPYDRRWGGYLRRELHSR